MRYLNVPLEQLAPDAFVDGVLTPEWTGALAKGARALLKIEQQITEAYVKVIVRAAAGRGL